jgi:serine/threonine protein phosphatase PrpC
MGFSAVYNTDIGIKKETNQDSLAIKIADTPEGQAVFAIVCDGMGGLAKGEVASKEVIGAFCSWFNNDFTAMIDDGDFNVENLRYQWIRLAVEQNERIRNYGTEQGIMLGTTLSAILIYREKYYIVHVGDSRIYEMTTDIKQLTQDQTLVAREIAAGRMTPEQAETDSRRSVLLQCIGASPVVEPDFVAGDLVQGATYMLCSDGFRHKITGEEILEKLGPDACRTEEDMVYGCKFLTELVKYRKEIDNITVVLIKS